VRYLQKEPHSHEACRHDDSLHLHFAPAKVGWFIFKLTKVYGSSGK
jgi:hypothetical protein